jgi:phosphoglycerate kinase
MRKKTLGDIPSGAWAGLRVLVRADFNVPLNREGRITDASRIRSTVPTLERLLDAGARVILLSHLGRPKGPDASMSLRPVAAELSDLLSGRTVTFVEATVGEEARAAVERLDPGQAVLLENTRFLPGETKNDPDVARGLAALGEHFVNDAFGTAHRAHASNVGVAEVVREKGGEAVAGLLLERELRFLEDALAEPKRPFVAIFGGAKISGKIDVIEAVLPRVDRLLFGGAMANTFFRALGLDTGRSLVEEDRVEMAGDLLERAGDRILLPVDCVVAAEIEDDAETQNVDRTEVSGDDRIGDVGPRTREIFAAELRSAGTVVWNGPMGVFERAPFAGGTMAVAESVADAGDAGALTIVGGGDSAAAVEAAGVATRISHVSTGGGASLELLSGASLPGVEVLTDREDG